MTTAPHPMPANPGTTPLDRELPGLLTCVHCGFCLPACPTYTALGDENDSPRGRLVLMRALVDGTLAPDDATLGTHISQCLGCRACETACPSGVPYGQLLEATRATIATAAPQPAAARLILWLFERRGLTRVVLGVARVMRQSGLARRLARLPGRVGAAFALLAASAPAISGRPYTPHGTGTRGTVAMLRGCVMDGLFAHTNAATARTLVVNDYALRDAPTQRCCGALHAHAGDFDGAARLARANIAAFEQSGADVIAVNVSGCGAHMKEYGHLMRDDGEWAARGAALASRVRDVSELLAAAGPATGGALPLRVTYDAPCHLIHAQRLTQPPLAVLDAIPGMTLVPLDDADRCCGGAGIYNVLEPRVSELVLAPKLECIARTGADLVATGNPGCQMQIGGGLLRAGAHTRTVHPVDLLDASYGVSSP